MTDNSKLIRERFDRLRKEPTEIDQYVGLELLNYIDVIEKERDCAFKTCTEMLKVQNEMKETLLSGWLGNKSDVDRLRNERDGLEAQRIAYASEFDGDIGSVHKNIRNLKAERDALEAKNKILSGYIEMLPCNCIKSTAPVVGREFFKEYEDHIASLCRRCQVIQEAKIGEER